MLCTLCQNYLIVYNMQLCGFHCIKGYSICILVIFPMYFLLIIATTVCSTGSSCGQQVPNVIRCHDNWLNTKRSLHSSMYFIFLVILVNFPLTGNDICHFQPKLWYFIISNASHSVHLFLAQWRHISSESAVMTVFQLLLELH